MATRLARLDSDETKLREAAHLTFPLLHGRVTRKNTYRFMGAGSSRRNSRGVASRASSGRVLVEKRFCAAGVQGVHVNKT